MQLKYDFIFDKIVDNKEYFSSSNIPSFLVDYIKEVFYKNAICYFDTYTGDDELYCPRCLNKIDEYCKECNITYDNKEFNFIFKDENNYKVGLYYFDMEDILSLYEISFIFELDFENKKIDIKSEVTNIYDIDDKSIYDRFINKLYTINNYERFIDTSKILDIPTYIYNNLEELKNNKTYKYTHIWDLEDYLNRNANIVLKTLLIYPLFYPQFEYLVKSGFYKIACFETNKIEYKGNYINTFNVSKDRINRFDKKDLSLKDLEVLKYCDIRTNELLNFLSHHFRSELFKNYIISKKYSNKDLRRYMYYCNVLINTFDYDELLDNKKSLFYPDDLDKKIDGIYDMIVDNNPGIDEEIKNSYKILSINYYEDDKYIIRPIKDLKDLLDEANMQSNCLTKYYKEISTFESLIYVMRSKDNINKSLVTIEIGVSKVKQARERFNKEVREEYMSVIRKWESLIVPIEVDLNL